MKKRTAILVTLLGIFLLIGCGAPAVPIVPTTDPAPTTGTLKVTLDFPSTLASETFDQTQLQQVIVAITQNGVTHQVNATFISDHWTASFGDLRTGGWTIQGTIKDGEGYEMMAGQGTAAVQAGTLTDTHLAMSFLPGDLNFNVTIPEGFNATYGSITLTNSESAQDTQTKDLVMANGIGSASFTDLAPTYWELEVKFLDADREVIVTSTGTVQVHPGRSSEVTVEVDAATGGLQVIFTWEKVPSVPTGLLATSDGYVVQLNWEPSPESNLAGYMVYRSTTNDPTTMLYLTPVLTTETNFMDTNVMPGETYWYWVQAYNSYGYSSSLTVPISVTIP